MNTLMNFDQDDFFHTSNTVERISKIHIHVRQQGRRWITTIEGLDDDLDQARIARAMKKTLHCAAKAVYDDKHDRELIMLQGKHADEVATWLVVNEVLTEKEAKERLVLHGA